VDLIGGVAGDADGVGFLSQHVEGIISNNRHVIEFANSAGLVTIQRLFALDCGTIERGLKLVKRANPAYVEVLPAPAYPLVGSYYPGLLNWPVLAGGLVKSTEEVLFVLEAGAVGVSTGHLGLWRSV
jgi:glycerol uptake operon antiterminator